MDCRKRMFWSLALLGSLAGCETTGSNDSSTMRPITDPAQLAQINPADIKKGSDLPKKLPSAKVCVLWGDVALGEANACRDKPAESNNKREQARKAYEQALKVDPAYLPAHQAMARWYLSVEDYDHAVATLKGALQKHPNNPGLWYDLGTVHKKRKDMAAMLECFTKAVEFDPENRLYVNTLGYAQARAGHPEQALQTYARIYSEAQAYLNVARLMQGLNQPEVSRAYLQAALEKDPQLPGSQDLVAKLNGFQVGDVQQTSFVPPEN